MEHIINHEKAHVQQWHSIDTILAHLLVITLWFNPFVWLYKKAVQQNLEFLADAYALKLANNHKLYQFTLLKTCNATYSTELTNNFYNSLIKKRILMLHKNKSENKSQWKYLLLLPLLVAFVFTFNTKVIAQEKEKLIEIIKNEQESNVELITKNTTKDDLNMIKTSLKKQGINFSYSKLKFNNDNEIIKISVKISSKNGKASASWENGNKPISSIKVGEIDGQLIASTSYSKKHEGHYTYTVQSKSSELQTIDIKGKQDGKGNYVFVTSNGKVHKGDNSHNVIIREIESDHGATKIWVSSKSKGKGGNVKVKVIETEDGKHEVKVIEEVHELTEVHEGEEVHEIEVIHEKNGENVFIIKSDGHTSNKHKISKKGDFIFISSENENPLYILNGKEISSEEMKKLKPETIEKIEILKGKAAIEKYGDKAKDGVIQLSTKKG